MWDNGVNIHDVRQIRTRCNVWFGVGAIDSIRDIVLDMVGRDIKSVLVVTGSNSYKSSGAWGRIEPALKAAGITYAVYNEVTPNPTTGQVDTAVQVGRDIKAEAVIGIGGGSALDAGKCVAAMMKYPNHKAAQLASGELEPADALPFLAVNLTHGTGSEVNRFAVITDTDRDFKPVIAADCLYPAWAIDDPALMTSLSQKQTRFVSIDAVNHVVEAATSKAANPLAIMLGAETIRLVAKYLPSALKDPKDLYARYFLAYAAMIAGTAFDNSLLHFTHALEHPLSALKPELSHGLGLSMLLPAVVKAIYPARAEVLSTLLEPIVPGLSADPKDAVRAARGVEKWLAGCGVPEKLADLGFSEKDVKQLTALSFDTPGLSGLLDQAPIPASKLAVEAIYLDSFGIQP